MSLRLSLFPAPNFREWSVSRRRAKATMSGELIG